MEIKEFFSAEDKGYWLEEMKKSDWEAGQYLYDLLSKDALRELCGASTRVFLLTDQKQLVAFCTLAEVDDVRDTGLGPWIGFVYTFPQYRGHRYMGILLDFAYETAKAEGAREVYISTGESGLYETYGYSFYQFMKDVHGQDARIYRKRVEESYEWNCEMNEENELLKNLDKLHTTQLGVERIKRNLSLDTDDVVGWCKTKIDSVNAIITRKGKNWYVNVDKYILTVNAYSYTIITAHKEKK